MKKFAPVLIGICVGVTHFLYVMWAILWGTPHQRAIQPLVTAVTAVAIVFVMIVFTLWLRQQRRKVDETWAEYERGILLMQEAQEIADHARAHYLAALHTLREGNPDKTPSLIEVQAVDITPSADGVAGTAGLLCPAPPAPPNAPA